MPLNRPHSTDVEPAIAEHPFASPLTRSHSLADRLIRGPFKLLCGLAMHAGLIALARIANSHPVDAWKLTGFVLASLPYSMLANILLLQGLSDIVGPRRWLSAWQSRAKRQLWWWCGLATVLIVALALFIALA